jgi:AcrR family transcriptional regulator
VPRKRTVSDDDILDAASRVMARTGPAAFTLAAVGQETGMAPATLLQRFGSKRGLMLAVVSQGAEATRLQFDAALKKAASPLKSLVKMLASCAGFIANPEELANHLAFLQMDLADPDFHAHTLAQSRAFLQGVERFLTAARRTNEIRPCDIKQLARTISITYQGALLLWCVFRQGQVGAFVRKELEAVLKSYRVEKSREK